MERPCNKCVNHISGLCSKWQCEPETIEMHDSKLVNALAKSIIDHITSSKCLTIEEICCIVRYEADKAKEQIND